MDSNSSISTNGDFSAVSRSKQRMTPLQRSLVFASAGVPLTILVVAYPFVSGVLRRHFLPYLPATDIQLANVRTLLTRHRPPSKYPNLVDVGSGDGRVVCFFDWSIVFSSSIILKSVFLALINLRLYSVMYLFIRYSILSAGDRVCAARLQGCWHRAESVARALLQAGCMALAARLPRDFPARRPLAIRLLRVRHGDLLWHRVAHNGARERVAMARPEDLTDHKYGGRLFGLPRFLQILVSLETNPYSATLLKLETIF